MAQPAQTDKYLIRRRSSAHSAYWMTNALVPAGLILIYRSGFSMDSVIGFVFVIIGALGYAIYKHKMRVPLLQHDGTNLTYRPSSSAPSSITMDSNARFIVRDLAVYAEVAGDESSGFLVSRLDFNSNEDWSLFIQHLTREPDIRLCYENE